LVPVKSIAACQILGAEEDKTLMTIGHMVNMTGHAKKPRCFIFNQQLNMAFIIKETKLVG
jgi:hypothetical protein